MLRFKLHSFKPDSLALAIALTSALPATSWADKIVYAETPTMANGGAGSISNQSSAPSVISPASTTNNNESAPVIQSTPSNLNNTDSSPDNSSNSQQDAPLVYGFFDRKQLATLPATQRIRVPASCQGVWITPIPMATTVPKVAFDQSDTTTRSDYAYHDPEEGSVLTGNVRISQPNRLLTADKVTLDPTQTVATATGNVHLADPGFVSTGDSAVYHLDKKTADIKNSDYIAEDRQAHGHAGEIIRQSESLTRIMDSIYSTCEPHSHGWKLKSHRLDLNQATGRGVARDTTLYVGNVPIFYAPYFNFPIDSRRSSGVLIPTTRYTSTNGFDLSVPYYLNLAPNYDATITPRIITKRNPMVDGEFRFLSPYIGAGTIAGAFLPDDPQFNDQDRKELSFQDTKTFNPHWSSVINLNYVSDENYFSDLGQTLGPVDTLTQERSASLNYNDTDLGLNGFLRAINYQELDKAEPDIDRPYGRIEFQLNYDRGPLHTWEPFASNDTGYFQREINDGSGPEANGTRQYNVLGIKYNDRTASGYFIPTASIRSLLFQDQNDDQSQLTSQNQLLTIVVPQFTLDSGLTFERNAGSYLQTLEPRFFYAYSPYVNQSKMPVFDTTYASSSYNQLFSPSRFVGNDRLDDNNFATFGVTNRFYDDSGLEKYRIGVADRVYFSNRETVLASTDTIGTGHSSGVGVDIGAAWNKHLSYDGNTLWSPSGQLAENSSDIHYATDTGRITSLGYILRSNVTQENQIASKQVTASFVQPVYNNFRVVGAVQYDFLSRKVLDGLLGIDYDACCWSVTLYGRTYYNDYDYPYVATSASRGIVLQVTFKGLASSSASNLIALLKQKIYGFTQVDSSWQNR